MAKDELDEELQNSLKEIVEYFDTQDKAVRERQLRLWKKMIYYWNGMVKLWWSEVAHDWRVFNTDINSSVEINDADFYDKPINVFRAYLESIIAAMSVMIPELICLPDDADNTLDCITAKGGDKIIDLVKRHNDAKLLWIKALYVYCTQGMVACYNYTDEDTKYGTTLIDDIQNEETETQSKICPECGMDLNANDLLTSIELEMSEADEYDPGDDDAASHSNISDGKVLCPNCQQQVDPELATEKVVVSRIVGKINKPKARQKLIVEGGLYVKVPNWARCQDDIPVLEYSYETHYTNVFAKYPKLRKKFETKDLSSSSYELYERWARISPQYMGEFPTDTPTVRNCWIRPSAFEYIKDDDIVKVLKKKFPDGCKVVLVNEHFADACNESLDDHWTLTFNPLSENIHFDPVGMLLTSVQEITNDLIALCVQTIEHGIPQTFADPKVLDFKLYKQTEATPGQIFPAKAGSGKSLSDGFYEVKTAQLSQEVEPFSEKIQELGQMTSGALPSLFGGAQENSSKTAAQYSMSRTQAMQRLQTPWVMFSFWWKNIFGKVVPAYIKCMLDDDKYTIKKDGSYVTILIERAKMDGKIGSVELESSEQLPASWGTEKDAIMTLFQLNNPEILTALADPKNLPLIRKAIGLNDFYVPGEDDREKQNDEIKALLDSQPTPGMNGQEETSIQPDPIVDNHIIEASICKSWCVSAAGRQAKVNNPNGYRNVLLHLQAHLMLANPQPNQQQQQQAQPPPEKENNNGGNIGASPTIQ